jgi:DNA-binding GntR family transcriptional regulator
MNMFDVTSTARSLPVWGSLKRRTSIPERRKDYHEQHTAIVAALSERNPERAHALMHDHLRHVFDDMLDATRRQAAPNASRLRRAGKRSELARTGS